MDASSRNTGRKRWRIWGLCLLSAVPCLMYGGLLVALYARQTQLIFAGSITQGRPEAFVVPPPPWASLVQLKSPSGQRVAALYAGAALSDGSPDPEAESRPTVLYCYGSGHCLSQCIPMIDGLRRDGLNVLMPEYLGYGMSGGEASEQGCMEAAEAAYQYLVNEKHAQPGRLMVEGGSLGAAVAVDVAANHPVGGLIMLSGFSSMRDMTLWKYPYVPVDLLLLHPMDSAARLRRVKCPVLIVHGTADEVVPYDMSQILLNAAPPGTRHLSLPGAGHLDTLYLCGPSGALLPTNLQGPHALFTPEVHQTVRDFFSNIFGPAHSARNANLESGFDQKRR